MTSTNLIYERQFETQSPIRRYSNENSNSLVFLHKSLAILLPHATDRRAAINRRVNFPTNNPHCQTLFPMAGTIIKNTMTRLSQAFLSYDSSRRETTKRPLLTRPDKRFMTRTLKKTGGGPTIANSGRFG